MMTVAEAIRRGSHQAKLNGEGLSRADRNGLAAKLAARMLGRSEEQAERIAQHAARYGLRDAKIELRAMTMRSGALLG